MLIIKQANGSLVLYTVYRINDFAKEIRRVIEKRSNNVMLNSITAIATNLNYNCKKKSEVFNFGFRSPNLKCHRVFWSFQIDVLVKCGG
jgi:signal recognition particle subunit SEC65